MNEEHRSLCPINLALEVFGDKWTLLIIRDMIFGGKRHFREMLKSEEHIASNILADRLAKLVEQGIVTRAGDPSHRQKAVYSLTEKGIALLPILAQIGIWGRKYLPASNELARRAAHLEKGGPPLWDRIKLELRKTHLRRPVHRN
jgi:DNA-binding HxlR family transcriptional regulator